MHTILHTYRTVYRLIRSGAHTPLRHVSTLSSLIACVASFPLSSTSHAHNWFYWSLLLIRFYISGWRQYYIKGYQHIQNWNMLRPEVILWNFDFLRYEISLQLVVYSSKKEGRGPAISTNSYGKNWLPASGQAFELSNSHCSGLPKKMHGCLFDNPKCRNAHIWKTTSYSQ